LSAIMNQESKITIGTFFLNGGGSNSFRTLFPVIGLPTNLQGEYAQVTDIKYNPALPGTEGLYEYVLFGNKAYVSRYRGPYGNRTSSTLTMPDTLGGADIIRCSDFMFSNYGGGWNVTYNATAYNYGFVSITFPSTLVETGAYVLYSNNSNYQNWPDIKRVSFGSALTTFGQGSFQGCGTLEYLGFGSSLTTIGTSAFLGCDNMIIVTSQTDKNANWASSYNDARVPFVFDDSSYADPNHLILNPNTYDYVIDGGKMQIARFNDYSAIEFTIPEVVSTPSGSKTVSGIADYAFKNKVNLQKLSIESSSIKRIGAILYGCSGIKELNLPFLGLSRNASGANGKLDVIFVGKNASLTTLNVKYSAGGGDTDVNIVANAINEYTGLQKITISGPVISIGVAAFNTLAQLRYLIIDTTKATFTAPLANADGVILSGSNQLINLVIPKISTINNLWTTAGTAPT
ncbi:MAG: hypothetical protein EZS28_045319, partial [Streblomastix strix]